MDMEDMKNVYSEKHYEELMQKIGGPGNRPKGFSFFAGAGGFDLGFLAAGCEIVGANEWDTAAFMTYATNLCSIPLDIHFCSEEDKQRLENRLAKEYKTSKEIQDGKEVDVISGPLAGQGFIKNKPWFPAVKNFWFGDIKKLKGEDILKTLGLKKGELDFVCGGPPCQGFSRANPKNAKGINEDDRNQLVYEYARLIVELQPKMFVMENVANMASFYDYDGLKVIDKFNAIVATKDLGIIDKAKKILDQHSWFGNIARDYYSLKDEHGKPVKENPGKETAKNEGQLDLFEQLSDL